MKICLYLLVALVAYRIMRSGNDDEDDEVLEVVLVEDGGEE